MYEELLQLLCEAMLGDAATQALPTETLFDKLKQLGIEAKLQLILTDFDLTTQNNVLAVQVRELLKQEKVIDWENHPERLKPKALCHHLMSVYRERVGRGVKSGDLQRMKNLLDRLAPVLIEIVEHKSDFSTKVQEETLMRAAHVEEDVKQIDQKLDAVLIGVNLIINNWDNGLAISDATQRDLSTGHTKQQTIDGSIVAPISEEGLAKTEEQFFQSLIEVHQLINNKCLHIQLLREKGLGPDTIGEIKILYREIVKLAKKYKISVYLLSDFAQFLLPLREYGEAIDLCEWLKLWYGLDSGSEKEREIVNELLEILHREQTLDRKRHQGDFEEDSL